MGIREEDQRFDHAGTMPHRFLAGDNRLDARLESKLGRLFFDGFIEKAEYEAGVRYGHIILMYLASTDAPCPYGATDIDGMDDDECFKRKLQMAAAKTILRQLDRRCGNAVDRICVYDEAITSEEHPMLRVGLQALANI